MPIPTGDFVARRLYRRLNGSGAFELVDQIPAQVTTFIDSKLTYHGTTPVVLKNDGNPAAINRPRLDGSLVIDPTVIMKSDGSHIEVNVGANLIAEGYAGQEVVFTSLADDRYGAGGTFDTRNDNSLAAPQVPAPGDWGGVFFRANSSGSIDHAVIAYGGGLNRIQGSFAGFNAIEVHQADVRIAESEFEFNASGIGGQAPPARFGRGFNGDSLIFVRGAQPVIVNNIVHDNSGAFVNINANAMNSETVVDRGRQRGPIDRVLGHYDNNGSLINGNKLTNNDTNGMIVRGGTLTTESVWDDTDIVHVLFDAINIPDFHTFGGLRLESQPTESLVIKSSGVNAGITANGRPLEMADRIGGRLEVLGQPGFPVILTSISDDAASAGFDINGQPSGDTNNDGFGVLKGVIGTLPVFPPATGPLLVTANNNATQLVNAMLLRGLPSGVTIPTSTYVGAATAAGTYINGETVPLEIQPRGIILSSGNAVIPATNTLNGAFPNAFSQNNNSAGDADLTAIAGVATLDAAVLTITINVTAGSGIQSGAFDFQFGSDEFSESIGSPFNDVFGGFINGGAATNFVRDSNGNIVSINNGFFNLDNETSNLLNIEYDGMTSGLTARFPLVVGTNVLKLAVGDAFDRLVDSGALITDLRFTTEPVTTGVGSRPRPGDWKGLTIDKYASDRNVAEILEQEAPNGTAPGANSVTSNAQYLGALAPNEKAGDDNRRLGFTVHGLINAINDVDVYSFRADAGTEVWIDLDRTTQALDSVVELIDNDGNVLARSDNSGAESSGAEAMVGIARRMQKSPPFQGTDTYTVNPRDAGFRVVLPGPNNTNNTYHVRVRSSSSDLSNVAGGDSLGSYQLQIRLREVDEFSGSTVQFSDVRYATVGIAVLGQPTHSPLSGEATETTGANNTSAQAQNIGNLLNTDRGSLGVSGSLSSRADADWYRLSVNYDAIQSVFEQPEDPSPEHWFATMFDIDYADGFARPNTIISVYDANLNLILSSRDSNVANDRPRPLNGADVSDLNRGSSGAADPFIGIAELPEGNYFVAVSSDSVMPREFQQYFQAGAANPLFRLEPINSSYRPVEDHIYIPLVDPVPPPSTAQPPGVDDGQFLSPGGAAIPFHLGDVGLYVVREQRELEPAEQSQVITVDAFTGQQEVIVGSLPYDIGDAAFRQDFTDLFSYSLDLGSDGEIRDDDSGHYLQINQGTAQTGDLGDDGIDTNELDGAVPPAGVRAHLSNGTRVGYGIQFDAMDFGEVFSQFAGDAFRGQRLVAVGHRGEADIPVNTFLEYRENIVYQMDPGSGLATVTGAANDRVVGAATTVYEVGEILTSARTQAPEATRVVPVVPATTPPSVLTTTLITDGMTFNVDDGFGLTTFEFDGGPELLQNISFAQGNVIRDGDFFLLDPFNPTDPAYIPNQATLVQFDSGSSIRVRGNGVPDGDTVTIVDSFGRGLTFEFDRDATLNNPTNLAVDISGTTGLSATAIATKLSDVINAQTGANFNVSSAFVADRVRLINDTAVDVTPRTPQFVDVIGASGRAPVLQAIDGNLVDPTSTLADGQQFQIRIHVSNVSTTFTFEFDDGTGPALGAGVTPINFNQGMNKLQIANQMNIAFNSIAGFNPSPFTTRLGDSRVAVNGKLINFAGNGFFNTSTPWLQDLTTVLPFVTIPVEDDFTDVQIGVAVAGTIGPPVVAGVVNSSTRYTASADGARINFPPIDTFTKDPVVDLNISGVPVWQKQLGAGTGVSSGNVQVIFGAADTANQIAASMVTAINQALTAAAGITATATGPFVRLSDGTLNAPNPPFNTSGQGPGGRVTGIAIQNNNDATSTENVIFAITNRGGLYRVVADLYLNQVLDVNDPSKYRQVQTTFIGTSAADLNGINFQGLTFGPRFVEDADGDGHGRYEDMLFGIADNGRVYAFNTAGVLQPIFANGATSVPTGIPNARGLNFTNLESNLWHTTRSRGDFAGDNNPAPDPGHGMNTPFDDSRVSQTGVRSFQFGRNFGGNYFAPGGAYGSIVSNEFDLTGYSSADQPVLYFNYRADTEGANNLLSDPFPMRDAFRVSIAGDDGNWRELGTNNSSRDPSTPPDINDEYDIDPKIQELFDNVNGFRQVRIDLADYAGQSHLRLRWDFTTAGTLNLGDIQTTGEEVRSVRGNQIMDGDVFEYDGFIDPITEDKVDGDIFEFDLGFSFQTPSGVALSDAEFFSVDDNVSDATPPIQFEFDKNGVVTPGRRPIIIDNTFSATQVASAIAQEVRNAFVTIVPVFLNTNFVELPEAEAVTSSFASALRRVVSGHTLVIPHTKSTGTPIADGETFTINDGRHPAVTFEYDLNGSVAAGNVAIVITRFMPENTIALRTYNAIAGALPDAVARYTTGARVGILSAQTITQSAVHAVRLDINATGIGVDPTHTAVVIDRSFSRNQVANTMNTVLEQFYYDQQILAVAGSSLSDGQNFTLTDGINPTVTFQMDTGYVLTIPSGGGNPAVTPHVNDGDKITLTLGATTVTYEFDKNGVWNGANTRVQITDASSQVFVARALSNAIAATAVGTRNSLSINPFWNGTVISGSRVQIGGTDASLTVVARNAANAIINTFPTTGVPGTTNPAFVPVRFQPSTSFKAANVAQAIRDAINLSPINTVDGVVASTGAINGANQRRVKLVGPDLTLNAGATGFTMELGNAPANTVANDVVKQYNDMIRVITHFVYDAGPLGWDAGNISDAFGSFNSNLRFQANNFEGIYLDDIIVGFAERGEIGTGPGSGGNFDPNPLADPQNIANGTYQLEVRRGPEFGVPNPAPPPDLLMFRTFDTNDLLTSAHQMVAPEGADLRDGETFILSDGVNTLTFEFNDLSVTSTAITPGNVRIDYRSNFTSAEVARAIQAAVNSSDAQAVLKLQAAIGDGTLNSTASTSNKVNLAGSSTFKLDGTIDPNGVVVGLATERNDLISQAIATNFDGNLYVASGTIGDNPTLSVNRATQGMDVDVFSIDLEAGQTIRVDIDAVTLGSNLDSVMRIFDSLGNPVIVNAVALASDDQLAPGETRIPLGKNPNTGLPLVNTLDPYLNFTAPTSGLYYIGVSAFGNSTYNPVTGGGLVNSTYLSRLGAYQLNISTYGATAFDDISNQNTFGEEFGDKNLFRDQGQVILQGNRVSNSSQFGIVIDNGTRVASDGSLPHQGPVSNLREPNVQGLVPGVVVTNNTIYDNQQGGILFSGDGNLDAPVPFGRIINNTLVGQGGTIRNRGFADIGISVTNNASPTLLNNVVVNYRQGISVDVSSRSAAFGGTSASGTILGGTLFQGNTANSNVGLGTGSDDFPIVLNNTDALFVDFNLKNYYLKEGSQAIDSSIDTLLDRPALVTVTNPLGIAESPILAPDRDGVGQKRVDDPNVKFTPPGGGFGENVAKDRGAIDRVDFTGPTSRLINPQDNDALGLDNDPADSIVVLQNQILNNFSIQLIDAFDPFSPLEGSGIDDNSVTARDVVVTATNAGVTRTLTQGLDYSFSYDATNNLIRLNPLGGLWPLSTTYKITLDNDPAADGAIGAPNRINGIFDLAGNGLLTNHDSGPDLGLVTYTIFLGSALDYGDAPDPTFPTLSANNGAAHQIKAGLQLGAINGADNDGQPSANADADASDDGVSNFILTPGSNSQVTINSSIAAKLDAWIDLNKDGDWNDAGEHVIDSTTALGNVAAGTQTLNFPLPLGPKGTSFARFRLTSAGIATPTDVAADGEVEDYKVTFTGPAFQNQTNNLDVTADGKVSPIDSLRIINFINRYRTEPFFVNPPNSGNMPLPNPFYLAPPDFLDVNGDGFVSPADSVLVVNFLNTVNPPPTGEGEGEGDDGGMAPASLRSTVPPVIYANSSVVVEVKSPAPSQSQVVDQVFGSGNSLVGDSFQPVIDQLHPSSLRDQKVEAKTRQRKESEDSWDDLLGDLAADVGKRRQES
ncbi:MAG: choice-of-anchor L domain-containing protein [Pirellulaceae bacterium]